MGGGNWFIEQLLFVKLQAAACSSCSGGVCLCGSHLGEFALLSDAVPRNCLANSVNSMSREPSGSACQSLNTPEYFLDNVLCLGGSAVLCVGSSSLLCALSDLFFFLLLQGCVLG